MDRKTSTLGFFTGTFITSFGSLLFVMSIPAFFLQIGINPEVIGLTIGIHRFFGIFSSAWFGPKIDRYNSRKVIIMTEIAAALTSMALVLAWIFRSEIGLIFFSLLVGIRAFIVGAQSTSRNRLVKLLSADNPNSEAGLVIWLNKVTQGAHFLSALVAIPLIASGYLVFAVMIDGISFLAGGLSAFLLPDIDSSQGHALPGSSLLQASKRLLQTHRVIFIQDLLLALAVSGTILLMVKLSNGNSRHVIYFNLIFGACIWLSSLFVHNVALRKNTVFYWLLMASGFILLFFSTSSLWAFPAYLVTYIGYWILFHKYTVEIQTKTPKELIGATMATRGLIIAIVLSMGELFGGYISNIIDLKMELFVRVCFLSIIWIVYSKTKAGSLANVKA